MDKIKLAITGLLETLTAFWGWFGWLTIAWVLAMMADIFTGMAAARRNGEWASSVAWDGLWRKGGCIAVVLITAVLDLVLGQLLATMPDALPFTYTTLLCPLLIGWYLLTEAGSIIENAGKMGARIPSWLGFAVSVLKKQVDNAADPEGKPPDK